MSAEAAVVGIVMGSDSDLPVMRAAHEALAEFGLRAEVRVLSAHRATLAAVEYARSAASRGIRVLIAGAGGAAHLPGVLAGATPLPVIGVPMPTTNTAGMDSLLSIAQMPAGVPVATMAIGGARNAGLFAVRILAAGDEAIRQRMVEFQEGLAKAVLERDARVRAEFE
jgi:5-(carboxyamino)imidazole ribonucleotide mutase